MDNKILISLEEMVRRIKDLCKVNPLLPSLNGATNISYEKGELSHIWLHGIDTNHLDHRVDYSKNREGEYYLRHLVWYDKKGWTLIGELRSNSIDKYRVLSI